MAITKTSKSLEMEPSQDGLAKLFFKSQFFAKTRWPPKDTDLSGQVAIVTGATTGLGLECARQLLDFKLSHLIVAVRSLERGESIAATLRKSHPKATVEVWLLEMESYESIQRFARRVDETLPRLDIAILNAGLIALDFRLVPSTGHESVIQVNYLSTMLLAILLLPILKAKHPAGRPGRLTIVNSGTSLYAKFPNHKERPLLKSFDDLSIMPWDPTERYWSSKLIGQLFFIKLFPHVDPDDVILNMVDPGLVKGTGLHRDAHGFFGYFYTFLKAISGRSMAAGASTYIDAAVVRGKESHGCSLMDWKIYPFAAFAYSPEGKAATQQLWEETLAGFEFVGAKGTLEGLSK
ncbi:NAD(P)-binding domain protein [Pleurostoma richardsiae]|uniref:NAD(P)-binding domain protein n=1 Tax=Pleurostoma richardsiae TaxID=41990 RepID=A0AA38RVN8_9PEZI|nr:NAD(P)-binding domain protein [Pleurostoma richardsiae]